MRINQLLKRTLLTLAFGSVLFLFSCNEDEDPVVEAPEASFTFVVDGATVNFTNTSTGEGNTYSWNFGDGNTSTVESPSKEYTETDTYTVTLTATNDGGESTASQDVTVTIAVVDSEAPVITLSGEAEVEINLGDTYTDAGAAANDNVDGDISSSITVGGDVVNVDLAGTYVITYDVTDAAGNAADQVSRTVRVRYPGGLVTNGDFQGATTDPWTVNFGDGSVPVQTASTNTFFIVNIETANAEQPFTVNLSQNVAIEQGKTYKLSFNASSDVERSFIAGIGLNGGSFASNSESVSVTTTEMRYELTLLASFGEDGVPNRVLFDLAGETGVVVLDNIALEETEPETPPAPTDAPMTPPERAPEDVISIYSDAYSNPIGITNVSFDDPSEFVEESIAGNNVLKVSFGSGFIGSDLGSVVDASGMTHFHMDFWVSDDFAAGQVFNPKWSNHAGGMGETSAFDLTKALGDTEVQTWVSIDVPISSFSGDQTRSELAQFLITVAGLIDLAYVDNIYFYNDGSSGGGGGGNTASYCETQVVHFGGNAGSEALLTIEKVTRADNFPALKFTIATDPSNGKVPDLIIVNSLEGGNGLEAVDTSVAGEVSIQAFWPSGAPSNNETTFNILWSFEGEDGNWQLFETVTDTRVSLDASCTE